MIQSTIPPKIENILNLARWAPSGDNTQCWQFEIVDDHHFVVHGRDTRDWCVYDLDGRASQIAIGALLENIALAASALGLRTDFHRRKGALETQPTIDVTVTEEAEIRRDSLVDLVRHRVTQRRVLSTTPLTPAQKQRLKESLGSEYSVAWIEGTAKRWKMARLLSRSARIRLTIPEAFAVHSRIIEWGAQYSEDKIPDQAVGLDPLGLMLMRWAMGSWKRVEFLNRYLAGTWLPRLQLDLLPGFYCGAHFLITSRAKISSIDDYMNGGRATQRFWLTATQLGLQFQPEMTPLIFARYTKENRAFSKVLVAGEDTEFIPTTLDQLFGAQTQGYGIFMGRLGQGSFPASRSTRLQLNQLIR